MFEAIDCCGVVAILRGACLAHVESIVDGLIEGGVRAIEISLTSPDSAEQIRRAARRAKGRAAVGAGTVLALQDVDAVAEAGARFIVSPVVAAEVIGHARARGLEAIPGAYTPSEALAAVRAGALAVKLFPADTIAPAFVRALRIPLPDLRLVPTGGVTLARARAFSAAGAWAVGVGSPLLAAARDVDSLAERAAAFVAVMRPQRS